VIEEAPSPVITPEVRERMGKAALGVAKACNYYGAGTVEFIVDKELNYYFLEMNTRLQVEHPVTEQITGIDLVKEQIKIAEGKALEIKQEDLEINGHSLEVRVYAEDPRNNFLPDIGRLQTYVRPQGLGVRVDDGFEQGMEIPIYYDPMIAKLTTFGKNREEAIGRMLRAIAEYEITGIQTTLSFCKFVLEHEEFTSGRFSTKFVEEFFSPEKLDSTDNKEELEIAVALVQKLMEEKKSKKSASTISNGVSKSTWKERRMV
jgi:propionyl-CoA carboxylase alpha chain